MKHIRTPKLLKEDFENTHTQKQQINEIHIDSTGNT